MPHRIVGVGPALEPIPLLPSERVIFSVHPALLPLIVFLLVILAVGTSLAYVFYVFDVAGFIGRSQFQLGVILAPAAITALVALIVFINWLNTIYSLTNLRVQIEFGILGERTKSIDISDVLAVQVDRTFLGRIFNFGDIFIRSATGQVTIDFHSIGSPVVRSEQIMSERR